MAGEEDVGVPVAVWAAYLRLATNRGIFEVPTPLAEGFTFLETVIAKPRHLLIEPSPRHLVLLRSIREEVDAAGDLVPDAVLGALAREHGAIVATLDRDFARFEGVRRHRIEV